MKFHEYIKKLQALPEKKKLLIMFTVVGIAALIMGFFWVRSVANSFSKLQSVNLPKIDIPQEAIDSLSDTSGQIIDNVNQVIADEVLAGWKTYANSEYGFEIKYPQDWKIDENYTTNLEFHLLKEIDKEQVIIDVEIVSQTLKTASIESAIDSIIKKMKNVIKPKEKVIIGNNFGYETIGTLCTAVCNDSSADIYSLFSIIYFSNGSQIFYVDYVEGIAEVGWKDNINNWKYYNEFKNIISTFKFINPKS